MLNLTRLNVFREVVDHGSFSDAADALSYSQSAVSQAIATLEGEMGTALIERRHWTLRTATLPVLPEGAQPLKLLQVSDMHMMLNRYAL